MKRLLFLWLFPAILLAEPINVPSKITSVTVYQSGATVYRTAQVTLEAGRQKIVLDKLPKNLNESMIQLGLPATWQIIDQRYINDVQLVVPSEIKSLEALLTKVTNKHKVIKDQLELIDEEEKLLNNNLNLMGKGTVNAKQFKELYLFYQTKRENIVTSRRALKNELEENVKSIQEYRSKLQELRNKPQQLTASYQVDVIIPKRGSFLLSINYFIENAGWQTRYNLKLLQLDQPLQLDHYAEIAQQSGEDWTDVPFTLSTGNPNYPASLPLPSPWRINMKNTEYPHLPPTNVSNSVFRTMGSNMLIGTVTDKNSGESVPFANIVVRQNQRIIGGSTSDLEGTFRIENLTTGMYTVEVSFLGYQQATYNNVQINRTQPTVLNVQMQPESAMLSEVEVVWEAPLIDGTKTSNIVSSDNYRGARTSKSVSIQTNLYQQEKISSTSYTLKENYSLPSDGNPRTMLVRTITLPAELQYQAVPALQEGVYLYANILDWRGLNLETGSLRIYTEGQYQGEFDFNPADYQDTLQLSLGRDNGVKVNRVVIHQKTSKNFFGSKVTRGFSYRYEISNDKSKPIRLLIKDQVPLVEHSDIDVDNVKIGTGKKNDITGIVTWEYLLEAGGKAQDILEFDVTYPKGWNPNLPR